MKKRRVIGVAVAFGVLTVSAALLLVWAALTLFAAYAEGAMVLGR